MLLDLTELSSYLPFGKSSFEFGNVSGDGGPRPRTTMTSAGTPPARGPSMAVSAPPGFASHLPFTHVAEASTRKNCASNAASRDQASKDDDMNGSQRMCSDLFARGCVCVDSHSAWLRG